MKNRNDIILEDGILQLTNLESLGALVGYFVYLYVSTKAINIYHLHKDRKPKKIKKVKLPPELKTQFNDVDLEQLSKKQFGECLANFSNVLIDNFSREDLTNFYNNINSLKTKTRNFKIYNFIFDKKAAASYYIKSNKVVLKKKNILKLFIMSYFIWQVLFLLVRDIVVFSKEILVMG